MMYQGASDDFLGPHADAAFPSEADGIDFEGEFGVITGPVPMGVTPEAALGCVRLLVQINDWSLRALGPHEMKTGFGFLQAKPSTAFAPVAVTPDELGDAWRDGRVQLRLQVHWNGRQVGMAHGGEMHFHFGQLIAHAARTRRLTAGCIVGSGTVSNQARSAGSSCIAELRVIEKIDAGRHQHSLHALRRPGAHAGAVRRRPAGAVRPDRPARGRRLRQPDLRPATWPAHPMPRDTPG